MAIVVAVVVAAVAAVAVANALVTFPCSHEKSIRVAALIRLHVKIEKNPKKEMEKEVIE